MAAGVNVGSLYATLALDARQYLANFDKVARQTTGKLSGMVSGIKSAIGGFLAFQAASGFAGMVTTSLNNVVALGKLSEKTGIAVADLQVLSKASEFAGATNLNLSKAINSVTFQQDALREGSTKAAKEFNRLGISTKQAIESDTIALFKDTVLRLGAIGDEAERNSIAFALFGKEAENLTGFFANGQDAFIAAERSLQASGAAISQLDAAKARVAVGAINDLKDALEAVRTGIAIELTPFLFAVANALRRTLNVETARQIAGFISKTLTALLNFFISAPIYVDIFFKKIELGWLKTKQEFKNALNPFSDVLGKSNKEIEELQGKVIDLQDTLEARKINITGDFNGQLTEILTRVKAVRAEVGRNFAEAATEINNSFRGAFESLSGYIADFVLDGKFQLSDFTRQIAREVLNTLAKLAIVNPILNGLLGSSLPTVFGGKAVGGYVNPGSWHVVGEHGPELFQSKVPGNIVPNDQIGKMGGGKTTVINADLRGASVEAVMRLEKYVASIDASLERRAIAANQDNSLRGRA